MSVKTENEKLFCDFCDEPISDPHEGIAAWNYYQYDRPGAQYLHGGLCHDLYTDKHPKLRDKFESLDEFLACLTEEEKKARAVLIKKGWIKVSPKSPELKTLATEAENGPVRRKTPPPI